ncbi:MAG: DUF1501 domain-containing protein [Deltaproteobacteria bacterium]|nr:MAG: DUF1501 domain-containing protein [Deltaproteobacteria bacterium]
MAWGSGSVGRLRGGRRACGAVRAACWVEGQVFDVHDPLDATDGIDVDVPQAISGLPPSQIATAGGITYVSNPVTRPAADAFFAAWGARSAVVNGINTRSTSHDQSRQLVLTGYLDPSHADFAVMAAHHSGADLPLPHLLLSGDSFAGPFAGLSGRIGGALGSALAFNRIPSHTSPDQRQLALSSAGESSVEQALAAVQQLDGSTAIGARLDQLADASQRGDRLVRLASSLPRGDVSAAELAASLAGAFRTGLSTSVTVNPAGGFDTHTDNTQQNGSWESLFGFLNSFLVGLASEPGVASASMLDETTVVCCSEFGRSPELNGDRGKDHHPWTSMLFVGRSVRPGTLGVTDARQEGVKVSFTTGRPDDTGQVIDVQNMVAGILTLIGANPGDYLSNVRPFTAMIA